MTTLSIIVPTVGRDSLTGTLASIAAQLRPGDELMVACNNDGNYGDRSLDRCQAKADGDIVLFCDDDDVYSGGALDRIRSWADANPGKIGLFRRSFNNGAKQWGNPELIPGNVQRMCIALPNVPSKMPTWTGYKTEIDIPRQAAELQGAEIVFVDDVVGLARPFEVGLARRLWYLLRIRTRIRILVGADESAALRP